MNARWTLRYVNGFWWLCKNGQQQRYATEAEVESAHPDGTRRRAR